MLKILVIVGARPNFIKAAPICAEMRRRPDKFDVKLVHTGQHYDAAMSDSFFADLGLPEPDFHLGVGSASHAEQTAKIMLAFEPVVIAEEAAIAGATIPPETPPAPPPDETALLYPPT